LALFMTNSRRLKMDAPATPEQLVTCFNKTFKDIEELKQRNGVQALALYNIVLTDGNRIIATRYSTDPDNEVRTLHYAEKMSCKICKKGTLKMSDPDEKRTATIISSEKLTEDSERWKEIPQNHAIFIDKDLEVSLFKLD